MTIEDDFQLRVQARDARIARILTRKIELEWERVSREIDSLDVDSGDTLSAAKLFGQFQILDKLRSILSEGSLSSDYEIEAQWRSHLIDRLVDSFDLKEKTSTPPTRYKSLAQQVAEACGLEVIDP